MAVNKVIYGGETLIDLTGDTLANANQIAKGIVGHLRDGSTVTGTLESGGGGSAMNVQGYHGYATVTSTSYTATAVSLKVNTSGTYNVSWMGYRNTNSGTSGSQLYIGTSAYGSANTTFVNTYGHSVKLTGVKLTAGQTITVRARARSTSYIMGVGNLIIEQTA